MMGKKVPCKKCGKLLGVRDVVEVMMGVIEDPVKTVTLKCPKCGEESQKQYEMK